MELKPAVCNKHIGMPTNGIVLCRDGTQTRMVAAAAAAPTAAIEAITKLKFEFFPHPAHSPDFTPSDYHISGLLRGVPCSYCFANDREVKDVVHVWICM
jgi:hypothetical protein